MTDQPELPDLMLCPRADRVPACPAVTRGCAECAEPVWVSLRMRPVVDAGAVRPLCYECGAAWRGPVTMVQHPHQTATGMSIGQFDQIAADVREQLQELRR